MRSLFPVLVFGVISLPGFFNGNTQSTKGEPQPIARAKKHGVEVCVNQVQVQRIGPTVQLPRELGLIVSDREDFRRTIAISLSQKGQGTTIGPTHIKLNSGLVLHPVMNGNQRFMSVVANADIPEDFDFAEYWFRIPENMKFADMFPLTVVYTTTNERQEKVEFELAGIEP